MTHVASRGARGRNRPGGPPQSAVKSGCCPLLYDRQAAPLGRRSNVLTLGSCNVCRLLHSKRSCQARSMKSQLSVDKNLGEDEGRKKSRLPGGSHDCWRRSISFYFFDIDDNLLFHPTQHYMWNAETKKERVVNLGEFVKMRMVSGAWAEAARRVSRCPIPLSFSLTVVTAIIAPAALQAPVCPS